MPPGFSCLSAGMGLDTTSKKRSRQQRAFHPGARSTGFTSLGMHTYDIQPVGSTCESEHGDVFLLLRPTSVSRGYSCSNAGSGLVDTASKKRGRQDRAFRIFMHTHKFRTIY